MQSDEPTKVTNEKTIDYCILLNKGKWGLYISLWKRHAKFTMDSILNKCNEHINKNINIIRINQNPKLKDSYCNLSKFQLDYHKDNIIYLTLPG